VTRIIAWLLRPEFRRRLLGAWLGATLVLTLAPFWPLRGTPCRFATASRLGAWDFGFNIAMFLPCGALLRLLGIRPSVATAMAALLSLGIESAQMYIPHRHPSQLDILANTLGALLGAVVATRIGQGPGPGPRTPTAS
jgi:glycopeptide antibiotics resistance protein